MQSVRGLRRAIPSTRPRPTCLFYPSRCFAISRLRSIKQSPQTLDVERPVAIREETNCRRRNDFRGQKAQITGEETRARSKDANNNKSSSPESADSSLPERSRDSHDGSQDLCSSVTTAMARLPHPVVVITTLDRTYHAQEAAGISIEDMRHPIARGITVSSFTSLCIRPRPHITFNMTLPSTMYEALIGCKDFNVHILTPDPSGARIASVFTRGNRLPSPPPAVGASSERPHSIVDIDADLGVFVGLNTLEFCDVEIVNRDAWHEQYQGAKKAITQSSASRREGQSAARISETAKPATRQFHQVPLLRSEGVMEVLHCRLVRTIHPDLPNAAQNVVLIGEVVGVSLPEGTHKTSTPTPIALGYADRKYRFPGDNIRH